MEFMKLDLGSLKSTKDFTKAFKQKNLPLHILICNAGIAVVPQGISSAIIIYIIILLFSAYINK